MATHESRSPRTENARCAHGVLIRRPRGAPLHVGADVAIAGLDLGDQAAVCLVVGDLFALAAQVAGVGFGAFLCGRRPHGAAAPAAGAGLAVDLDGRPIHAAGAGKPGWRWADSRCARPAAAGQSGMSKLAGLFPCVLINNMPLQPGWMASGVVAVPGRWATGPSPSGLARPGCAPLGARPAALAGLDRRTR